MTELKRCPDCGESKPRDLFSRNRSTADGLSTYCKACCARRNSAWAAANPDKMREYGRRSDAKNRERRRAREREKNRELRAAVFDHYGWSCVCCGSTQSPTIDHVNGDGKVHRSELFAGRTETGGPDFYRWLIRNGFPDGYQTLCKWCNTSKGRGPACHLAHGDGRKAAVTFDRYDPASITRALFRVCDRETLTAVADALQGGGT